MIVKSLLVAAVSCLLWFGCSEAPLPEAAVSETNAPDASQEVPCPEPEGPLPEQVLARICGRSITVDHVLQKLGAKSDSLRRRLSEPERLREYVDSLVRFEVLLVEAKRQGLDEHPDVVRVRDVAMVRQLQRGGLRGAAEFAAADIPDEEIEAYYRSHQESYNEPEYARASHIQMSDSSLAQRLLSQILEADDDAELFGRLASEHSENAKTRARGGDLGYIPRPAERWSDAPEIPREVAQAVSSLDRVGDVFPELVQTSSGWHIVKLTGHREAWHMTLAEARNTIPTRLLAERRQKHIEAFVDEARERMHVELNEPALERLQTASGPRTR